MGGTTKAEEAQSHLGEIQVDNVKFANVHSSDMGSVEGRAGHLSVPAFRGPVMLSALPN